MPKNTHIYILRDITCVLLFKIELTVAMCNMTFIQKRTLIK